MTVASLLGLPGRLVAVNFRGERVAALAEIDHEATAERPDGPLTDLLHLELLTGWDEAPWWRPPVRLHAAFACRRVPMNAVARVSQWGSYTTCVAVVPRTRMSEQVQLEASLRGIWVLGYDTPLDGRQGRDTDVLHIPAEQARVLVPGEYGPSRGSQRGLMARLLNEVVWQELAKQEPAPLPHSESETA